MQQPFDPTQKELNRSLFDNPRLLSGPFWGELRVFLAVAKAKSFNRAAEELNISQPTVSRQVRRLQDMIGSQLVVSTQNGIRLTAQGKELASTLMTLDEKLFEISHELKAEKKDAEGLVRVSVTEALAGLFVVPNLTAFSESFPKLRLHIRNPTNLTDFRENQTDVMIGFTPCHQAGVSMHAAGVLHFLPVASRDYIERNGIPTRKNLYKHRFIDSEYYSAKTDVWNPWRSAVSNGTVAQYCDNSFAYGLMVRSGLGIGLLCNYALAEPTLVPLEINVHIVIPIYIYALTERLMARPVKVVYDWLAGVFSPDNPWFAKELNLRTLPRVSLSETMVRILDGPASHLSEFAQK